jgi:hypothetical protein
LGSKGEGKGAFFSLLDWKWKYCLTSWWKAYSEVHDCFFRRAVALNCSQHSDQTYRTFPPSETPASLPLLLPSLAETQKATNVRSLGHTIYPIFFLDKINFHYCPPVLCVVLRVMFLLSNVQVDISTLKSYMHSCRSSNIPTIMH